MKTSKGIPIDRIKIRNTTVYFLPSYLKEDGQYVITIESDVLKEILIRRDGDREIDINDKLSIAVKRLFSEIGWPNSWYEYVSRRKAQIFENLIGENIISNYPKNIEFGTYFSAEDESA